jgi:hypothetical protein
MSEALDLKRPYRIALRILFVGIAALAAWCFLPDKNNTLPITEVIEPGFIAAFSKQQDTASQPTIVVTGVEHLNTSSRQSYKHIRLALVNPTSSVIEYVGYNPNSFSERPPRGEINPWYSVQINSNGALIPKTVGRCGVGRDTLIVMPAHAGCFDAYCEDDGSPFQIGVNCIWTTETGARQEALIWSEPIEPLDTHSSR